MNDETRPEISEITEATESDDRTEDVVAFISATGWATLSGTACLFVLLLVRFGGGDFAGTIPFIFIAVILAGFIALAGMITVMLPLTLVLKRAVMEDKSVYAFLGGFAGALVNLILFGSSPPISHDAWMFIIAGAVAGATAGYRWGRWREFKVEHVKASKARKQTPNPIHDLIY